MLPDISRRLQSILLETGADPMHLGIEVTESVLMHDLDHARRTLDELSAIGIQNRRRYSPQGVPGPMRVISSSGASIAMRFCA